MSKKFISFLEGLVIVMIVLVLVQTFVEDLAVLLGFTWSFRKILIVSGFVFDLFFTLEFLTRFYVALSMGDLKEYMGRRQGWIDLIASVPLVILNSGPAFVALMAGSGVLFSVGGILNILKIVKTVRIARILRLLRVLKIFKQIKNTNSVMAQRHIQKVTAMVITTFVFTVFVFSLFSGFLGFPQSDTAFDKSCQQTVRAFTRAISGADERVALESTTLSDDALLIIKKGGITVFSKHNNSYFYTFFGTGDYIYFEEGDYSFFFDMREVNRLESRNNLMYFLIIVIITVILMFVYSPHFAMTISDPIHVMRRGLDEKGYNFQVKILDKFKDDDVFRLGESYNEVFLAMKDLQNQQAGDSDDPDTLELKMEDLGDLGDILG
ncbi:MAG: ion transporter [Spirochaetales bacterium]|nr:ion transporter [Spirochaetales bacterium]